MVGVAKFPDPVAAAQYHYKFTEVECAAARQSAEIKTSTQMAAKYATILVLLALDPRQTIAFHAIHSAKQGWLDHNASCAPPLPIQTFALNARET